MIFCQLDQRAGAVAQHDPLVALQNFLQAKRPDPLHHQLRRPAGEIDDVGRIYLLHGRDACVGKIVDKTDIFLCDAVGR